MEFVLRNYSCSLCGKEDTKLLLTKQKFSIVQCCNCNFVYINPRIVNNQLATIYKHNYFKNKDYGYVGYEQEKRLRVKNFERWLNDASGFIAASTDILALDVGCAAGYCLALMKERGWKEEGLELDQEMCLKLRENDFNVSQSMLEDFKTENRFSVITLFDVIEHIPNVDGAFKKLSSLLTENGVVIMVTPDHDSFQRKILGKKWFQYKPIEHIQYFNRRSLKIFAERNGLKIIYQKHCGQYADADFLLNRLYYYQFPFLSVFFKKLFGILKLNNRYFYTDTGSLYVILKRK
jgi:2-polyprenyl-3-methyl-5-hydroxy-6-metoxy-1,4-benzoquinol methylase